MPTDDGSNFAEGNVSVMWDGIVYRGRWAITGTRITVYLGLDEESTLLGMFVDEPEKLARMLLSELIKRQLARHTS